VITGRVDVHVRGNFAAGGTLQSIVLHGQLSGLSAAGHVYLPPGYQAQSARHYAVVLVISNPASGSSSPYAAWRLAQSAAVEIAARRMPPLIMVMLPAALAPNDRACLNVPPMTGRGKPAAPATLGQTFFAEDVPAAVQAAYNVSSQPADWALLGDQSGGYCALQLALDDSYTFAVAVAPPGDYSQPPGIPAALSAAQFRQQDDLIWQLSHLPMQPVSVLFAGPGRGQAAGPVQPFRTLARPPMRVSMMQLAAGSWPLGNVLDWIGAAMTSHVHQG
jgi:enterochelin esterase-like enzyme